MKVSTVLVWGEEFPNKKTKDATTPIMAMISIRHITDSTSSIGLFLARTSRTPTNGLDSAALLVDSTKKIF